MRHKLVQNQTNQSFVHLTVYFQF